MRTRTRRTSPGPVAALRSVLPLAVAVALAAAAAGCSSDPAPAGPAGSLVADGVSVSARWEPGPAKGDLILAVTLTPQQAGYRIVGTDLPAAAARSGLPATLVGPGRAMTATGPATTDAVAAPLTVAGVRGPVQAYPAGPVTFRLPLRLGLGVDTLAPGAAATVEVTTTACGAGGCTTPWQARVVSLGPPVS